MNMFSIIIVTSSLVRFFLVRIAFFLLVLDCLQHNIRKYVVVTFEEMVAMVDVHVLHTFLLLARSHRKHCHIHT